MEMKHSKIPGGAGSPMALWRAGSVRIRPSPNQSQSINCLKLQMCPVSPPPISIISNKDSGASGWCIHVALFLPLTHFSASCSSIPPVNAYLRKQSPTWLHIEITFPQIFKPLDSWRNGSFFDDVSKRSPNEENTQHPGGVGKGATKFSLCFSVMLPDELWIISWIV